MVADGVRKFARLTIRVYGDIDDGLEYAKEFLVCVGWQEAPDTLTLEELLDEVIRKEVNPGCLWIIPKIASEVRAPGVEVDIYLDAGFDWDPWLIPEENQAETEAIGEEEQFPRMIAAVESYLGRRCLAEIVEKQWILWVEGETFPGYGPRFQGATH